MFIFFHHRICHIFSKIPEEFDIPAKLYRVYTFIFVKENKTNYYKKKFDEHQCTLVSKIVYLVGASFSILN